MQSFAELKVKDIQGRTILLDVGGTLTHENHETLEEPIIKKVRELKANGNKIYLYSNKKYHYRDRAFAKFLEVHYVKADLGTTRRTIIKSLKKPKTKPLLVIGDKFLTDGRLAKKLHADFMRVGHTPIVQASIFMKVIYRIDNLFNDLLGG